MVNILAGTPLGDAVQRAQQAMNAGNYQQAVIHYQQAIQLADDPAHFAVRKALWIEHVGGLLACEQLDAAAIQSEEYLVSAQQVDDRQAQLELLVLLGEALAAQDKWANCRQVLAVLRNWLDRHPDEMKQLGDRTPHLIRLLGLDAAEQDDVSRATLLLFDAAEAFAAIDNQSGQRTVINDLRRLGLLAGNAAVVDEVLNLGTLENTYELLLTARALRRDARYEAAIQLIEQRLQAEVEPALRFPLLHELTLLYQSLTDQDTVQRLLPLLSEAASVAADPAEAHAAVNLLRDWQEKGFTVTEGRSFEARLHKARALIQNQTLEQAERELTQLRPEATTPRLAAYWSLIAGELELALGLKSSHDQVDYQAQQALGHLARSANLAWQSSLPNVYAQAIRLTGRVYAQLYRNIDLASYYWARTDRTENLIAHRQETDQTRIRYLEALPTQYDELITATAARVTASKGELLAGVIAAMEAARGSAILSLVLPSASTRMRDLPLPNNPAACLNWYTQITRQLPRNMAVWLLHATPDQVHHGLVGRDLLRWASVSANRHQLGEIIDELKACWDSPSLLEALVQDNPEFMSNLLAKIAQTLQLNRVLVDLPENITRLAIVAGDALGDIPFAALPLPGTEVPAKSLITRYAISDLPCLSAQHPLAQRAITARGDYGLTVGPPASGITSLSNKPGDKRDRWLNGHEATIEAFDHLLTTQSFPWVRIDTHGSHLYDEALDSWLELARGRADDGRLTARRLQTLSLNRCGILILGACESGMSQRLGRDERIGFVRAGLAAGASAILAARWVAAGLAAATILARFQGYLRYLPRDQALQRAQLDLIEGRCPELMGLDQPLPHPDHPARWACWTLYGDAGLQTSAGWLVRLIRRFIARYKIN
jgi:hypothetical protein